MKSIITAGKLSGKAVVVVAIVAWTLGMARDAGASPMHAGGCAPTISAAIANVLAHSGVSAGDQGFRVEAVHLDPVRSKAWAVVESCSQPGRPLVAVQVPRSASVTTAVQREQLMVRAGQRVIVRSRSGDSAMELNGIAEESGVFEQEVRVRLDAGILGNDGHAGAQLRCGVVEDGVVEVVR